MIKVVEMMNCNHEEALTPFCPVCGEQLGPVSSIESSLISLVRYLGNHEAIQKKQLASLKNSYEKLDTDDWRKQKSIETRTKLWGKWKGWLDAVNSIRSIYAESQKTDSTAEDFQEGKEV